MKNGKCKLCGKYEIHEKEVGKFIMQDDIELPVFHHWKWCHLNNNWCRNIAGNCGEVISEKRKTDVEFEEKQGFDFKMTMGDEI